MSWRGLALSRAVMVSALRLAEVHEMSKSSNLLGEWWQCDSFKIAPEIAI